MWEQLLGGCKSFYDVASFKARPCLCNTKSRHGGCRISLNLLVLLDAKLNFWLDPVDVSQSIGPSPDLYAVQSAEEDVVELSPVTTSRLGSVQLYMEYSKHAKYSRS